MVLFRALGWMLLALGVGAVVFDGLSWWSDGAFHLLVLGDLWSRLDLASLTAFQRDRRPPSGRACCCRSSVCRRCRPS